MTQAPSNAEGPIPRSFSEAMRFGERERSMSPLEHSGVQPIGTPEFDHINYDERRKRDDSAA